MPCSACSVRTAVFAAIIPVLVASGLVWDGRGPETTEVAAPGATEGSSVLTHTFELIDGTETSFDAYRGKVVLIVNTASACGLTPQYKALEELYRTYKDRGLVVIGFPANNFLGQEPGTNDEILAFCTGKYDVTFPMAGKISVKGEDAHPLYRHLAGLPEPLGGEPTWNFTKFLVDREGSVAARFEPRTAPDAPALVEQIEALLGTD